MTTSATTTTAADLLEGRAEIVRDDNRDGYYVADTHGAIVALVEQAWCGCCWTARLIDGDTVVTLDDEGTATLDDALAQLAYALGQIDVEALELVDL